ncbi:hypothetical protein TWF730_006986 [Orbilia blumenaviensis]|uniref:Calcineurin-like phosphoesterase domain-containing protein n=1 Tax=Orbilia blumenaviensis TaxID=1796055 RepID=A0AAV9VFW8_9PEZI
MPSQHPTWLPWSSTALPSVLSSQSSKEFKKKKRKKPRSRFRLPCQKPEARTLPPQHIRSVLMLPSVDRSSLSTKKTRKTRFICMGDTHNLSPYQGGFKVPKGDVLIHAGDMTKQGTYKELKKTIDWIQKLVEDGVVEQAIVIAGNHELTLDPPFYASHGHNWHSQDPQDPTTCLSLFAPQNLHPSITFLNHSSAHIILKSPSGPGTHFKVFGSPYTPLFITKVNDLCDGSRWAFQYSPFPNPESEEIWKDIPSDTDVLITHGPPYSHLDGWPVSVGRHGTAEAHKGCEGLRRAVWKVRPKLQVFGHVHQGRGVQRVMWRDGKHVVGMEEGCACSYLEAEENGDKVKVTMPGDDVTHDGDNDGRVGTGTKEMAEKIQGSTHDHAQMEWIDPGAVDDRISGKMSVVDVTKRTRMFGGVGLREGETLMVNAAVRRGGWPYEGVNKVVVVDMELEVWDES